MTDEPTMLNTALRELEQRAITLYREMYPDGPPWQELDRQLRSAWVYHAERGTDERR